LQLQLALALSKEEHDEEMKRQKADDLKLQMAIEESKKTARRGSSEAAHSQV
jgi:epsin